MREKVIYQRFAYSPSTGQVTTSHNHEGHPALLSLHEDLKQQRSEQDLILGYAYRTASGWRLTDENNKAIEDPHIIKSVIGAIHED
jgi:hypothetical protein